MCVCVIILSAAESPCCCDNKTDLVSQFKRERDREIEREKKGKRRRQEESDGERRGKGQ